MEVKDFGRTKQLHDLDLKPSNLPVLVKVADRRSDILQNIKHGDLLAIRRIQKLSGFLAQLEGTDKHLFIPASYDGLFQNPPVCYPLVDDLRQVMPQGFVRVTRKWRSPYKCTDSIYLNDRLRIERVEYVRVEELGNDEMEVLVCLCRNHPPTQQMIVRLPMDAEGFFEECDAPSGPSFKINKVVDFPTRTEVLARASQSFVCEFDDLLKPGTRMQIQTQMAVTAIVVTHLRNKENVELLQHAHPLKIKELLEDRSSEPPPLEDLSPIRFVHVLTQEQAEAITSTSHAYADLDTTELEDLSLDEVPEVAPNLPPRKLKATVRPIIREVAKNDKPDTEAQGSSTITLRKVKKNVLTMLRGKEKATKNDRPTPAPRTKKAIKKADTTFEAR